MNPSYLTPSDTETSRSNTPNIKLPLQMMDPVHLRRSPDTRGTTSNTNRSWLENRSDRDSRSSMGLSESGVPMSDLRHKATTITPQRASQVTITSPTTLPAIGDEESRPESRASRESEWNSAHPCYPHRNPYVPLDSPEYASTRIIRIARDFMVAGDLAPTYSNVFPEILEPHVSEEQFRGVVARVNEELQTAYDPWNWWNWMDAVLGLLTLWMWEEVVETHCKRVLKRVEGFLEEKNREMEKGGQMAVFVPLRRTGYLNLDIQIPDPISPADGEDESKFDMDNSETGSIVPPLGSDIAGSHHVRPSVGSGRGRMGSLGSGEMSPYSNR